MPPLMMASEHPSLHTLPEGIVSLVTPLRVVRHCASVVGMLHGTFWHIAVLLQQDGGMLNTVSPAIYM